MGCASSAPMASNGEELRDSRERVSRVGKDFHEKYILGLKLGEGGFAQVRTAIEEDIGLPASRSRSEELAVNIVKGKLRDGSPTVRKPACDEEEFWAGLDRHANCVRLHEVFHDDLRDHGFSLRYMVMEKCHSTLFKHFSNMTSLTERTVGQAFAQMLQGLAHVHDAGIVHRDVKPDNFLVGGEDKHTVKLGDFGLAARLPKGRKVVGLCGTAPFMCPEMLADRGYDDKADVWSLGVTAYVFLFGTFPYLPKKRSNKLMKLEILAGPPPTFEPTESASSINDHLRTSDATTFVNQLLHREPTKRPSARESLKLQYMMAVESFRHACGVELPSLRLMLKSAKRAGAFESQHVAQKGSELDELLSTLQTERGRPPLPSSIPAECTVESSFRQSQEDHTRKRHSPRHTQRHSPRHSQRHSPRHSQRHSPRHSQRLSSAEASSEFCSTVTPISTATPTSTYCRTEMASMNSHTLRCDTSIDL